MKRATMNQPTMHNHPSQDNTMHDKAIHDKAMHEEPKWTDEDVDEALEESFPASDPPSYTNDGSYVERAQQRQEKEEAEQAARRTSQPATGDA